MVDVHAKPREVAEERRPRVLLGDRRGDDAQQVEGGGRGAAEDQHAHGREPPRLVAARVADHEHEQHAFHEQQCRRERRHRDQIVADDDRADEADEAGVWVFGADDHDGECGGRCCQEQQQRGGPPDFRRDLKRPRTHETTSAPTREEREHERFVEPERPVLAPGEHEQHARDRRQRDGPEQPGERCDRRGRDQGRDNRDRHPPGRLVEQRQEQQRCQQGDGRTSGADREETTGDRRTAVQRWAVVDDVLGHEETARLRARRRDSRQHI